MIPYFPKQIYYRAIITYLVSLITISLLFSHYAMKFGYMALGFLFVIGFFAITNSWSQSDRRTSEEAFLKKLFLVAFILRLVWVIAAYFYYIEVTGVPFEPGAADSMGYHEEARWLASEKWSKAWDYYFGDYMHGISDVGYPLYLTCLYKLFGPHLLLPRIIKAFLGAWTVILVYRLSCRTFGEDTARMAGIMTALMPNLIIYCGYHLKETEMIFLEVAFLERLDFTIRNQRINFWNVLLPSLLAVSLFLFRTVLGAAAVFAFATTVLVTSSPTMKRSGKRIALIGWGILAIVVASGGAIMTEVEGLWEGREDNVSNKRLEQTLRGNQWAQYATGTVMAPMMFVLPFSTMVDVSHQYAQLTKHGGNFIRNFMGFFIILAVYEAFRRKKWRDFAMIGSFVIAYLGVISLSGFSNSERFLLPGLPGLIMMWAYGVSTLRKETYKLLAPWCFVVFAMEIGWAYFKLGNRGLV